jgi:hypothetical protein
LPLHLLTVSKITGYTEVNVTGYTEVNVTGYTEVNVEIMVFTSFLAW